MKRFHVHLNVADLAGSIRFYSHLFATEPTVLKHDYAKWMLEDPRINFAISNTSRATGIDHLGLQVDTADELVALGSRLDGAGAAVIPEVATVCCYARSDKLWTADLQGTRWETFRTVGEATTYHDGDAACASESAACAPATAVMQAKSEPAASCCGLPSTCC